MPAIRRNPFSLPLSATHKNRDLFAGSFGLNSGSLALRFVDPVNRDDVFVPGGGEDVHALEGVACRVDAVGPGRTLITSSGLAVQLLQIGHSLTRKP